MQIKIQFFLVGILSILDLLLFILTEPSLNSINAGILNDYEEIFIQPFFMGSLFLILCLVALSFFGQQVFNIWLKYIASWYIPLSIFFISQIDIHSSFILNIDRSTAAVYWMGGLFILTGMFVGYHSYIAQK